MYCLNELMYWCFHFLTDAWYILDEPVFTNLCQMIGYTCIYFKGFKNIKNRVLRKCQTNNPGVTTNSATETNCVSLYDLGVIH